jgi:YRPW motif-containing protein
VGFRECVAEVARYMVTVEGMDIQDPLRLRLLSHLQCYSAQREAAAKASLSNMTNSSWGGHNAHSAAVHHAAGGGQYHQQGGAMGSAASSMSMISQHAAAAAQATEHGMATGLYSSDPTSRHMSSSASAASQSHMDATHMAAGMRLPATGTVAPQMSSSGQVTPSVLSGLSHSQFPVGFSMNSMPMLSPSGTHYSSASSSLGKPYRPWGAELAY